MMARMERRRNPWDHLLIQRVPELQAQLDRMPKEGWAVIDSSDWSIEQTVEAVLRAMGIDPPTVGGLGPAGVNGETKPSRP